MQLLVLFALCLCVGYAAGGTCRQDWEKFQESCYGFGEEKVTWGDAEEMCRITGARLVEIETDEENTFLKNQARQKNGQAFWIGGSDVFHEGSWVWMATGTMLSSFTDWGPQQPDDGGDHEDCLELVKDFDYQWNDYPCVNLRQFICEADANEDPIVG